MNKFGFKCSKCGKGIIRPREFTNYTTKIENQLFTVPSAIVGVCEVCDAKYFDPQERCRWIHLFHRYIEAKHVVLNAEEIKKIRSALQLTMEDFAHLIGCTRQSIYNWENRKRKQPQSRMGDLLIKLIRERLYKQDKIDILDFLINEASKIGISIKLKEDIGAIVGSEEYVPLPAEEYSKNFIESKEPIGGFAPRLKR